MRVKAAKEDQDDESDGWESAEEDAPVVRLEELLNNMKIDADADENQDDDESKEE